MFRAGLLAFPTGSSLPKPVYQFSGVFAVSLDHCAMVGITAAGPRRIRTVFPIKPLPVPVTSSNIAHTGTVEKIYFLTEK
jgi:hypothetical protein